jgi:hypothetical protein
MIKDRESVIAAVPDGWAVEDDGSQVRYIRDSYSVVFHFNGLRLTKTEYMRGDSYHRDPAEGPAAIKFFENGDVYGQFFMDGEDAAVADSGCWKRIGKNLFSLNNAD